MNLTWLLDDTGISAATRLVLTLSDRLVQRGHRVRIVTPGLPLTWRRSLAEWAYVDRLEEIDTADDDVVLGTSWTTLAAAERLSGGRAIHFCTEDEAAQEENADVRSEIEAAYSRPARRVVPSEALAAALSRHGAATAVIGVTVDEGLFRAVPAGINAPPRVLLCGHSRTASQGLEYGYGAAAHARWFHQTFDLVRLSAWAPSREEPLDAVQEFHVALSAEEAARLIRSCDVLLAPALHEQGVDLAMAEAMAAGLACVATAVPAHQSFGADPDHAAFAAESNAVELGDRLIDVLGDPALLERLRTRGREVAEEFRADRVVERFETALRG